MRRKPKRRTSADLEKYLVIAIIVAALILIAISDTRHSSPSMKIPASDEFPLPSQMPESSRYHVHIDFLVMINGKQVNFNKPAYDFVDTGIHIHIQNYKGDRVLHIEEHGVVMDDFFYSIGMGLNGTCFYDGLNEYCNGSGHKLRLYINDIESGDIESYEPHDLDRILITYGNETQSEISKQLKSVTGLSCVFSQKCTAPPEAQNNIFYN